MLGYELKHLYIYGYQNLTNSMNNSYTRALINNEFDLDLMEVDPQMEVGVFNVRIGTINYASIKNITLH
jgi:hypothetical protein